MRKLIIILTILFFTVTVASAIENQVCGIGARLLKDPFGKKTFNLQVLPNSPAEKYNLPVGAEIISVNDVKTKSYNISQISEMITGQEGTTVNLLIKYNGKKN